MKDIRKKEYRYTFANGDVIRISTELFGEEKEKWIEILLRLDLDELSNAKKEKRRHCSLESVDLEEKVFVSDVCIEELVEDRVLMGMFYKTLVGNEKYVFIGRFCDDLTMEEVAKELHLTKGRVCQIEKTVLRKLRLFFETH